MSIHRLILVIAALGLIVVAGHSEETPVIPDGVYRDAGSVIVLTLQGKTAVLETSLLGGTTMKVTGFPSVHADGTFSLSGMALASNQYDALFGRRKWKWQKDHFVVKESVPPGTILELRRQ